MMKKVTRQAVDKKKLQGQEPFSLSQQEEGTGKRQHGEEEEQLASKKSKLLMKKEKKFQEDIERCRKLILTEQIEDAIQILKDILTENLFLEKYEFKGSGNIQSWAGFYPKGPLEWFQKPKLSYQISKNPFDYLSTCFMVALHLKTMTIGDILGILQALSEVLPDRYQLQFCYGNAYYNKQMFVKAEQHYFRALSFQKHPRIYEYIGWLKGYWFQIDKVAVQYCQKCLQITPDNIGALYVKSLCVEDLREKKTILKEIVSKHPDYYRMYISLATDENLQQKMYYFDQALCYDANYPMIYAKKGQVLKNVNVVQARQQIATALKIDPEFTFAYWVLASIEQYCNNTQEAIANYQKCLQINPYEIESTRSLAHLYRMEGDNARCLDYYEKYVQLNPYDEDMYNYLGLVYDYFDRAEDAIECYKKAIELNPAFFEGYSNIGLSFQQKQMYGQALNYYKKAYSVQQNGGLCYGIAICQKELGNPGEAQKWALLSIEKGSDDDKEVYEFLGDLFRDTEAYKKSAYWYLQHVGVTRSLNTDYIESNFVIKVPRETAIDLLSNIAMTTTETTNNLFIFLQTGKLLLRLYAQSQALTNYEIAKSIFENQWSSRNRRNKQIRNELNKVFGDPKEGTYNIKDRMKFKALKEEFGNKFKEIYGLIDHQMKEE